MLRTALIGLAGIIALSAPGFSQAPATPVTPAAPVPTVTGPVMTIDEAIATAVQNSPGLATAVERVKRAQNQLREARALSNFTVGLTANYAANFPQSTIDLGPGQSIVTNPAATRVSATLTQPIDISGALRFTRGIAGLQLNIQQYAEAQTLQQLILDVKTAYYNVLRARAAVTVAESSVASAEARLRVASAQFEAGTAPRFDVTSAEVDVANRRQALIQALNAIELSKSALNTTMGIDANAPVEVSMSEVPAVEPVRVDIPANIGKGIANRPEIRQARTGIDVANTNVRLVGTQDRPTLALFATSNWTSATTAFSSVATNYTYGASVNWPIWSGGVTRARVAAARNDVAIARLGLDQVTLGVELEVRNAALNLMEASSRVGTARAGVDLAQEALRLAMVRYQEGVSTQVEVSNAETALTQAQIILVNATYDYVTASAQLERATASQPEYVRMNTAVPTTSVAGG